MNVVEAFDIKNIIWLVQLEKIDKTRYLVEVHFSDL